jgi:hypothetical protein
LLDDTEKNCPTRSGRHDRRHRAFSEVNFLEEDIERAPAQALRSNPYAIKTIKIDLDRRHEAKNR